MNFDSISGFLQSITFFSKHKLRPFLLKKVFFADLSATLSKTFCWEGLNWSVDKEVLLIIIMIIIMIIIIYIYIWMICNCYVWLPEAPNILMPPLADSVVAVVLKRRWPWNWAVAGLDTGIHPWLPLPSDFMVISWDFMVISWWFNGDLIVI